MKLRLFCALLVLLICSVLLLPGCNRENPVAFNYELENRIYICGEEGSIAVTMENKGEEFSFKESEFGAYFYVEVEGEKFIINCMRMFLPDMVGENRYTLNAGAISREVLYFNIPDDAPAGAYSLYLYCKDMNATYSDVIEVKCG